MLAKCLVARFAFVSPLNFLRQHMFKLISIRVLVLACLFTFGFSCGLEQVADESESNGSELTKTDSTAGSSRPSHPKINFSTLTDFSYQVNWETHGKTVDPNAFAMRVPPSARSMDGRTISIEGYMIPILLTSEGDDAKTTEFLLLPDTKACCEGITPKQNGWILVSASDDGVVPMVDRLLRVTGQFSVKELWNPGDGFFKGLYHLACEEVKPVAL